MSIYSDAADIKPGDTVTVQGTVVQAGTTEAAVATGALLIEFECAGGRGMHWAPRESVVGHTPKPAPQCRSLFGPAGNEDLVRCRHSADHVQDHENKGYWWTSAIEYGRVTARGEQS